MKIGGYALEEIVNMMAGDFAQGLAELKRMLKRYKDDGEAQEIARRLEAGEKMEALEELRALADSRKLEDSGASGSLPGGNYRRAERTEQAR